MPLFQVQDVDRSVFVVAATYAEAVDRWMRLMAKEQEFDVVDCLPPQGVIFVCDDDDFLPAPADGRPIDDRQIPDADGAL